MNKEITESLELIGRSLSCLAVLVEKGDTPGHPFRGNQWDSGGSGDSRWQESGGRSDGVLVDKKVREVLDRVPLKNPNLAAGLLPNDRAVNRALDEAEIGAKFSRSGAKPLPQQLSSLRPSEIDGMTARPELVERYRNGHPVDPVVVNASGTILDGHHRAASALAAGCSRIFTVVVKGNKEKGVDFDWKVISDS